MIMVRMERLLFVWLIMSAVISQEQSQKNPIFLKLTFVVALGDWTAKAGVRSEPRAVGMSAAQGLLIHFAAWDYENGENK